MLISLYNYIPAQSYEGKEQFLILPPQIVQELLDLNSISCGFSIKKKSLFRGIGFVFI
jgi:hypothetical protein